MQTDTKKKAAKEKVSGKKMTGAEALILALLEEGVDTVFGRTVSLSFSLPLPGRTV